MKKLLLFLFLAFAACSDTLAYDGPLALHPFVSVERTVHMEGPRFVNRNFVSVVNPSTVDVEVDVDCDVTFFRNMIVPARSEKPFLANPLDRTCSVRYAR